MRLRAQALEIVDEAIARELRVLEVHAHVDRLLGADFLAVPAEYATELVDLVDQGVAVALLVLPRHELDAVGGADLGAQPAGDAFGAPLLVGEHAVGAAPARRERPVLAALFLRVLHRHLRPPQVAERERHALERGAEVGRLGAGPLHHLHADGHVSAAPAPPHPPPGGPGWAPKNAARAGTPFSPKSATPNAHAKSQPSGPG